jgi:hypothetical protein
MIAKFTIGQTNLRIQLLEGHVFDLGDGRADSPHGLRATCETSMEL